MQRIVVTGGTGLVGSSLVPVLQSLGYEVIVLSTNKQKVDDKGISFWDPSKGVVDEALIQSADYIIHLAGYSLVNKRWNDSVKALIVESRVQSAKFLYEVLGTKNKLKAFISASGVGYYGAVTNDHIYTEPDMPHTDFVANVCVDWEGVADLFQDTCRVVKLRLGIVMAHSCGALAQMELPVKLGVGSALGIGIQYIPWIHVEDLVNLFVQSIQQESMKGVYNAVAPEHVTNDEVTKTLAKTLSRPYFFPNVPAFVLKVLFGEMGALMLEGSKVSAQKIKETGFVYKYPTIKEALEGIYNKK